MSNSDSEKRRKNIAKFDKPNKEQFWYMEVYKKFLTLNMPRVWYRTVKTEV